MKQILRYLKPYLGKLLAATVLIALSTLCDLLLPTWMSAILNGGIAARDFPAIAVRCLQMLAIAAVSLASILGSHFSPVLERIDDRAFSYCDSLENVSFPPVLKTIGKDKIGRAHV